MIREFQNFRIGDIFIYQGNYFMKIHEIIDIDGDALNAVFFTGPAGDICYFHPDEKVEGSILNDAI